MLTYKQALPLSLFIRLPFSDTQRHADEAAKVVSVTYKDPQPLILTIDEAIAAKSYLPPQANTLLVGDPDGKNWYYAKLGSVQ